MSSIYAELKVITNSGIVNGYKKNNAIYWDDIPYAKPPINELRWRAPVPIDQSEVLIEPKDNNFCIQKHPLLVVISVFRYMIWVQKIAYI